MYRSNTHFFHSHILSVGFNVPSEALLLSLAITINIPPVLCAPSSRYRIFWSLPNRKLFSCFLAHTTLIASRNLPPVLRLPRLISPATIPYYRDYVVSRCLRTSILGLIYFLYSVYSPFSPSIRPVHSFEIYPSVRSFGLSLVILVTLVFCSPLCLYTPRFGQMWLSSGVQ